METHIVTATNLNVRATGSTSGAIVGTLRQGTPVAITEEVDGWGKTPTGWVSMKFLRPIAPPPPPPPTMDLADRVLSVARSQLGRAEEPRGSNWGPAVHGYLASVGITFPAAWCMAFAYWCVDKAAREAKVSNPLHKTGGVMAQWNALRGTGHRVSTPRRGDLFVMSFGKGLGHIGFVERVQGDRIMTIEGNSNDEGSREGHEVCRKPGGRAISSCIGFIRLEP